MVRHDVVDTEEGAERDGLFYMERKIDQAKVGNQKEDDPEYGLSPARSAL